MFLALSKLSVFSSDTAMMSPSVQSKVLFPSEHCQLNGMLGKSRRVSQGRYLPAGTTLNGLGLFLATRKHLTSVGNPKLSNNTSSIEVMGSGEVPKHQQLAMYRIRFVFVFIVV